MSNLAWWAWLSWLAQHKHFVGPCAATALFAVATWLLTRKPPQTAKSTAKKKNAVSFAPEVNEIGDPMATMQPEPEAEDSAGLFDPITVESAAGFFGANTELCGLDSPKAVNQRAPALTAKHGGAQTTITFEATAASPKLTLHVVNFVAKGSFGAVWKVCNRDQPAEKYALKVGVSNIYTGQDNAEQGTTKHSKRERRLREFRLSKKISAEIRAAEIREAVAAGGGGGERGWYNLMETHRLGEDPTCPGHPVILMPIAGQNLFVRHPPSSISPPHPPSHADCRLPFAPPPLQSEYNLLEWNTKTLLVSPKDSVSAEKGACEPGPLCTSLTIIVQAPPAVDTVAGSGLSGEGQAHQLPGPGGSRGD